MSNCKIHNVRFYKPEARAIHCMALQTLDTKLAISRSDATLEIWNLNCTAFIEKMIPPSVENFSIEGLVWIEDRLFSIGLYGILIEYNLYQLNIKHRSTVTGGAGFCLDANKNHQIAVGTEQGYLNIFKVQDDGIYFDKFLDKQEGKIISIKFDHSGEFIVSGSLDAIRIWNVSTGHAIHKMTTGRTEAGKPTIVWCLEVTSDFTIISGDSRGKLTFWDGKVGAQLESYQSHKADILSICLSSDGRSLYCAGIDPNISNYQLINVKGGTNKWVKSIQRKIHDHDVRAMVLVENKLYSGGVDCYLACSFHPPKTLIKSPPVIQTPCVTVCKDSRQILLKHPQHLEVWSLGTDDIVDDEFKGLVPLKTDAKRLLVIHKTIKSYDNEELKEGILCSSMSANGNWIVYSTNTGTRLLHVLFTTEKPTLTKVNLEDGSVPCVQALFTSDSKQLILAPCTGGLSFYALVNTEVTKIQHVEIGNSGISETVSFLKISACGKYLAVADSKSNIILLTLKNKNWNNYCKLPKYNVPLTALSIHPTLNNIVVAYSDNKIVEYSIKKKEYTQFSRYLEKNTPKQWRSRSYPIRNITFDPRAENIILLHDDSSIIILNKDKKVPEVDAKIPKIDSHLSVDSSSHHHGFYALKKYKHLVHLSWLADDELVAVEVNPLRFLEQLPPAFIQKSFGRK